ncbi:MAG: signal peptidase II [Chlorobi bacterium]|nr:signal peptidase II [Chlorobiota bacterium]
MRGLFFSLLIVIFDQLTKLLVKGFSIPFAGIDYHGMYLGQSIPVIDNFLFITYIENPNMAFGIEVGGKLFLSIFSIVASVGIIVYLYFIRDKSLRVRLPLAIILGGAIGNLIDRMFYGVLYGTAPLFHGNVVDFVNFDLFTINFNNWHFKFWPIFNVADMAVSIGVLLLVFFGNPKRSPAMKEVGIASPSPSNHTKTPSSGNSST